MTTSPLKVVLSVCAAALLVSSCATKKHVKHKVDPVAERLARLEEKTKSLEGNVAEVETTASRADERAKSADSRIGEVSSATAKATEGAAQANSSAAVARSLAEASLQKTIELEKKQAAAAAAPVAMQVTSRENLLFGAGSAFLSAAAKEQLDVIASKAAKLKAYEIEVQGFSDPSGSAARNLALSKSRADAAARYLASRHGIALHKLHVLGMGIDKGARTPAARRLARRVEVRVMSAPDQRVMTSSSR